MKIVQVHLKNINGNEHLTTWVDVKPGLKHGAVITLKDYPDIKWVVAEYYPQEHDSSEFDWHRKWDNNI